MGETAYFVERFCAEFPEVENVLIYLKFSGLNERELISRRETFDLSANVMGGNRISRTPTIESEDTVSIGELRNNMAEVVYKLLKPVYEIFGFFPLSRELVARELSELRKSSF